MYNRQYVRHIGNMMIAYLEEHSNAAHQSLQNDLSEPW